MEEEKTKNKKKKKMQSSSKSNNSKTASSSYSPSPLVGSIVEKGISDEPQQAKPFSFTTPPNPTVLPFPVARNRSHGPHWGPVGSIMGGGGDENGGGAVDEECDGGDGVFMDVDHMAQFAKPVERKKKQNMDFSKSKVLNLCDGSSSMAKKSEGSKLSSRRIEKLENVRNVIETVDKSEEKTGEVGLASVELDLSERLNLQDSGKDTSPVNFKNEVELMLVDNPIDVVKRAGDDTALAQSLKRREHTYPTSSTVSCTGSDLGNEQGTMSLESEIDAENRAKLQGMSRDEIEEAQAEIMEKLNPGLLKLLKKRGEEKLKQKKVSTPDISTGRELKNIEIKHNNDGKTSPCSESGMAHMAAKTSNDFHDGLDDSGAWSSIPDRGRLWKAWSERVEAIRVLRFRLDGTVTRSDLAQVPETARDIVLHDYLLSDGDPGAAGYTIKEAVANTQNAFPGQRAFALRIILVVLKKALHNIQQGQAGYTIRNVDNVDNSVDWEAVWAYALGPEPNLILALRICLDDDRIFVAQECVKVIQCILSCALNEYFFDLLEVEKSATIKYICTAPVFRSKQGIDVGFLHGGFWKYSAKPSNISTPVEDIIDDETEAHPTIQDDIIVARQDFAAGFVRMGILIRLRYLLESDPEAALEECIISILVAIARHSPTCAKAVMKCERLVQIVVDRFTPKQNMEVHHSMIKSVILLKVLAQSDLKNCQNFVKNGIFHIMTWHLYQHASSLDQWVKSGQEKCKLSSALMVEQLRFWKVCIQHGYCVSYYSQIFPALCLWLNPPTLEKLVENNVVCEFASISNEVYLVLEVLAGKLPNLFSQRHLSGQTPNGIGDYMEIWSWSHVGPIVDIALKWMALLSDPQLRNLFECKKGISGGLSQYLSLTSLLWVYSAVFHMLAKVLERVSPDDISLLRGRGGLLPWLPEFVPKVGLKIIKAELLGFSGSTATKFGQDPSCSGSFVEKLCYLRQRTDYGTSFASLCCLHGLVQAVTSVDSLIQLADKSIEGHSLEYALPSEDKVLKHGILKGSAIELRSMQNIFIKLVNSAWHSLQSIEMFGRGGPAPGVGIGWGASGGGYWSTTVLLAQNDARFLMDLLDAFQFVFPGLPIEVDISFNMQINSILAVSLIAGPKDRSVVEKALMFLLDASFLKYLDLCIHHFLETRRNKPFGWKYEEEDYTVFNKLLTSHYKNRWLSVKKTLKPIDGVSGIANKTSEKNNRSLDTIYEDSDTPYSCQDSSPSVVEWAHQRLPLHMYWFLSPISTLCDSKDAGLKKAFRLDNLIQDLSHVLEVAKAGLFFLLGIEAMSSFLPADVPSPVQSVRLVWKLHSLSVILLVGMGVIEEEKSRDVYEALHDLYGGILDKARLKSTEIAGETIVNDQEVLRFKSEIHDGYSTFLETLVEQFSAVSYGDIIYGRQVAVYLHRCVEASVRLAAWNALANNRVLELLPPLETCIGEAEGYLQPTEDNANILEAYVKSWTSGALDRAASRRSVAYELVLHHLSSFLFQFCADDKLILRNKLARSLLQDFSQKKHHEVIMLNLICYDKITDIDRRFMILIEACERNSSLIKEVERLNCLVNNSHS